MRRGCVCMAESVINTKSHYDGSREIVGCRGATGSLREHREACHCACLWRIVSRSHGADNYTGSSNVRREPPRRTFLKSTCVTRMRRSRSASSPASVHSALMSAPDSSSCRGRKPGSVRCHVWPKRAP